ncbi:FAP73 [Symbiodinium natans]|uniref:FAP73 protein n=1 Tax=Symbiodinium natans TaxID=878477 RepID=A0A812UYL1_9DINO|nr:FAP73 [Symbiodinium natans]
MAGADGERGAIPKHPQQLFFDNVNPATRLLEKRRQMYEVQDALENQKARFAKEEDQFRKKEEQLRVKDLQLQNQLVKFNKFLQDNEAKRQRSEKRAAEEAAQIKQKDDEILDLEKQLEDSKALCSKLEEEKDRNMKYEEFLELVKETCDDYAEISEIVERHSTLEGANIDLSELQADSETRIEELRNQFQIYKKEQEMEMMELRNKVAILQIELDECQKKRQQLQHEFDEVTQEDSRDSLFFGQILMSVENLFLRCTTKRKNIQHAQTPVDDESKQEGEDGQDQGEDSFRKKKDNAARQLKVILAYLKDFKEICEILRKERRGDPMRVKLARAWCT